VRKTERDHVLRQASSDKIALQAKFKAELEQMKTELHDAQSQRMETKVKVDDFRVNNPYSLSLSLSHIHTHQSYL
jgi:hypothetical protein